MSSASCGLNDKVKVFSKIHGAWVIGMVTHVYPNGDLQVDGIDNWEWTTIRCSPEETSRP